MRSEDFQNIDYNIDNQPILTQCICYAAARLVPGSAALRETLRKHIYRIIGRAFRRPKTNDVDDFAYFNALVVLYCLSRRSPTTWGTQVSASDDISIWSVKAVIEIFAMRIGLHQSVEEVKRVLILGKTLDASSPGVRRYTLWLWLYTMAHHVSLITGSPPSIREDSSIRSAPTLLQGLSHEPAIQRLLGEVELCLLWETLDRQHSGLGEWWRAASDSAMTYNPSQVIVCIDSMLDTFKNRYEYFMRTTFFGRGLDFHFRFARFCLTAFSLRHLKPSLPLANEHHAKAVSVCVDAAVSCLRWLLDLGPIERERLRHPGDFAFVMMAFCAMFILKGIKAFEFSLPDTTEKLALVKQTAQLMIEVALDKHHSPYIYGTKVMRSLQTIEAARRSVAGTTTQTSASGSTTSPEMQSRRQDEEEFGSGPVITPIAEEVNFNDVVEGTEVDFLHIFPDFFFDYEGASF